MTVENEVVEVVTEDTTPAQQQDVQNDVFEKGKQLIEEMAMIGEDHQNLDLLDLEERKAKTENFKASLRGIMEISHELELLSSKDQQFKRKDELTLLNTLRKTCTKHAQALESMSDTILDQIKSMLENPETIDLERLENLQEASMRSMKQLEAIVAQSEQLIRIERMSGGRPYGYRPGDYKNPQQYAQYLFSLVNPKRLDANPDSPVKSPRIKTLTEAESRELKRRA